MRFTFLVVALLVHRSIAAVDDGSGECIFRGNMCDVKPVKQCFENVCHQCTTLHYPNLYKTNATVTFWIEIEDLTTYADDLKITVKRIYNESTWESIDSCCNMGLNETCQLPPSYGELEQIFVPMATPGQFCQFEIGRNPAIHPAWCVVNPTPPCVFLQHGHVVVNESFLALSTYGWPSKYPADYCFFYAPSAYGRRGKISPDDGLTRQVEGITAGDDGKVRYEDVESDCIVVSNQKDFNLSSYLRDENTRAGHTFCAFIRMLRYDDGWDTKPLCVTEGARSDNQVLIIATTITAVIVIIAIALFIVCKKFVLPSYDSSVKEGIITQFVSEPEKYHMNDIEKDRVITINNSSKDKSRRDSNKSDRYVSFSYDGKRPDVTTLEKDVMQITPGTISTSQTLSYTVESDTKPEVKVQTASKKKIGKSNPPSLDSHHTEKEDRCLSKISVSDLAPILNETLNFGETEVDSGSVFTLNNNSTIMVIDGTTKTTPIAGGYETDYLPKNHLLGPIVPEVDGQVAATWRRF